MNYLFWICWIGEMAAVIFWLYSELRLTYIRPNMWPYLFLGYLLLVLAIRYGLHLESVSNKMVMVPGIPLALYGLMILLFVFSGKKWN